MPWEVCIVGKVSAAKRILDKRFAEAVRGEIAPQQQKCLELAKEIVKQELDLASTLSGDRYISITAAGQEDNLGFTEIKMAVRLLPGFVEE